MTNKNHTPKQKPDFEELAVEGQEGYCRYQDHSHDCGCGRFEEGAERIWNDYVTPILSELTRLRQQNEELRCEINGYNEREKKMLESMSFTRAQLEANNARLRKALDKVYYKFIEPMITWAPEAVKLLAELKEEITGLLNK